VAVLLVDLDHFADVNRIHGRLVGSSLLAEVGAILQLSIRSVDLASRWTGDTFALLLPETDRAGACRVAHRIQARLRSAHLLGSVAEPSGLTASVGIAVYDDLVADPERSIHDAEALMRAAQSAGEMEAVTFAPEPPAS
jgi:diguanylate cyclase (GGDEF)-like protein